MKKIAISFIGTGNYVKFFPKYYETINEYFIPECEKHFFVLTDGEFGGDLPSDITIIPTSEKFEQTPKDYAPNGWVSMIHKTIGGLYRFETIKSIKNQLSEYDWYAFIDADYYVSPEVITYEEFFDDSKDFFAVQHPCFTSEWSGYRGGEKPFERNSESLSCVKKEEEVDDVYLQGCLWGGKVPKVFELIDELDSRIKEDIKNNFVTKVTSTALDENHLNRYRIEHADQFHILHPSFAKPGNIPSEQFLYEGKMIHSPAYRYELLGANG